MGCSDSAPVMEKKIEKELPKNPATKPKSEDPLHFIFGHIAE